MTEPSPPTAPRVPLGVRVGVGAVLLGVVAFAAWHRLAGRGGAEAPPARAGDASSDATATVPPPTGILPGALGPMPDVPAVERSGRAVRTGDLLGRWVVADLVFTSCGGPCPRLTAQMKTLQDALPADEDLRLVTFTVDPARDTPEVLAKYARDFGADPQRWWFRRIVGDAFRLLPEEDLLFHSNHFLLIDPEGRLRALYLPLQEEGWREKLLADLATLRRGS
jgi:cytochrome oxidase Cu insertion factor (SCO1/SenC/PrrC family)